MENLPQLDAIQIPEIYRDAINAGIVYEHDLTEFLSSESQKKRGFRLS